MDRRASAEAVVGAGAGLGGCGKDNPPADAKTAAPADTKAAANPQPAVPQGAPARPAANKPAKPNPAAAAVNVGGLIQARGG